MQTKRLGNSGIALSALSLGTLTWGRDTDLAEATALYSKFIEAGGTTLDVPSCYQSQLFQNRGETVSTVIANGPDFDPVIVLHSGDPAPRPKTLLEQPVSSPPCSRRQLLRSLDHDLVALGRRSVDVWVVHGPRLGVSCREIADAMVSAVSSGRASYVGLADMDPWSLGAITSLLEDTIAPVRGVAAPFSLLDASAKVEILPHCAEQGIGFIALAPLASGVLTGKYRHNTPTDSRGASSHLGAMTAKYLHDDQSRVVEAVVRVAEGLRISPSAVVVAWAGSQPTVATCAVGPRTVPQMDAILTGYSANLPRELRDALSEVSLP